MANPMHSSESQEHYTPKPIIEAARAWMGAIDLDPASCEAAQRRVRATRWFSRKTAGLGGLGVAWRNWSGDDDAMPAQKVFLNPPGGGLKVIASSVKKVGDDSDTAMYKRIVAQRYGTKSHMVAWWLKACDEITHGNVRQMTFVGFSLELLQMAQGFHGRSLNILKDAHICVPSERLRYTDEEGNEGADPTHGNVIIGVGGSGMGFTHLFGQFGWTREALR